MIGKISALRGKIMEPLLFEQLNISYIRDELDPYIDFLNKTFGKDSMKECIEYMTRLKKLT